MISPAGRHARIAFSLDFSILFFAVRAGYDDLVGFGAEALLDCRDDGGEEGIVEVGDDDSDNLGLSRPQHRGSRIGAIVERFHRGFDFLDELGADTLPAGQNVRDGSRRNASHPRHIIDRMRFFDHYRRTFAPVKRFSENRFTSTCADCKRKIALAGKNRPLPGRLRRLDLGSSALVGRWTFPRSPRRPVIRPTATSLPGVQNVRFTSTPAVR